MVLPPGAMIRIGFPVPAVLVLWNYGPNMTYVLRSEYLLGFSTRFLQMRSQLIIDCTLSPDPTRQEGGSAAVKLN